MECPYCAEDFNDTALVCNNCGRDLRLVLPVIRENIELVREAGLLQMQVNRLRAAERRRHAAGSARARRNLPAIRCAGGTGVSVDVGAAGGRKRAIHHRQHVRGAADAVVADRAAGGARGDVVRWSGTVSRERVVGRSRYCGRQRRWLDGGVRERLEVPGTATECVLRGRRRGSMLPPLFRTHSRWITAFNRPLSVRHSRWRRRLGWRSCSSTPIHGPCRGVPAPSSTLISLALSG